MARVAWRPDQIGVGIWLIGLGILLYTSYWWPGILFVLGAATIGQGLAEGRGWRALDGAFWIIGTGLWFALGSSLAVLLIVLGVGALLTSVRRLPPVGKKPEYRDPLD
ncbi:MAG TPA: hypothetical protein VF590_11320 [Isosphaeraceae bacterium]